MSDDSTFSGIFLLCRLFGAAVKLTPTDKETAAMIQAVHDRHPGVTAQVQPRHKWRAAMSERTGRPVYYHTDDSTLTLQFNAPSVLRQESTGIYSVRVGHRGRPQHVELPPTTAEIADNAAAKSQSVTGKAAAKSQSVADNAAAKSQFVAGKAAAKPQSVAGNVSSKKSKPENTDCQRHRSTTPPVAFRGVVPRPNSRKEHNSGKRKRQQPKLFFGKQPRSQWACQRCTFLNQRSRLTPAVTPSPTLPPN